MLTGFTPQYSYLHIHMVQPKITQHMKNQENVTPSEVKRQSSETNVKITQMCELAKILKKLS